MVRNKNDGQIYAMKILKKQMVLQVRLRNTGVRLTEWLTRMRLPQRRQYEHTLSERRILENIDHPFIVSLRFGEKWMCVKSLVSMSATTSCPRHFLSHSVPERAQALQ